MKNSRLLSLILCFIFVFTSLLTCLPAGNAIASTIALYNDDFENAQDVLNEICPGLPLSDGVSVTRAEFVTAVTMLLGKGIETNVPTGFADVGAEHAYSGNIKYAKDLGLISSVEIFSPDSPVTYAQAIKILMCATGHGQKAEFMGGYPAGYFKVANDAKVGSYLSLSADANLTHKEAISLIFEAACTDILDVTAFGDSFEYAEIEGRNILSVIHKVYMAEGVANANKLTGLYSVSADMDSEGISVNGNEYYGEGYNNLLGKKVRVFFKGEKKRNIVAAYGIDNRTYSFTHEDSLTLSGNNLVAIRDGVIKEENYTLDSDYAVIFNGKYFAASENSYNLAINPDAGMIEFVDNNGNNKIDVIIVKSVEYGVIDTVNAVEGKIYDKFKPNAMKVLSDDIDYSIVGSDGEALEISDLAGNTVVGYAQSKDGKALEIIRFEGKMGGTYSELSKGSVLVLGKDKEVTLSKYFTENIKGLSDVKLGTQIIAYLGIGNQVVYVEEYSTSISYGYLSDFSSTVGSGLNARPCARIYSEDGEMLELDLAEKLTYNGTSGVSRADAATKLEVLNLQPHIMKVIKFAVNANGELSKVYEATRNTVGASAILDASVTESRPVLFDDNTSHGNSSNAGNLYFDYGIFFPYFTLRTGAAILQIPSSAENADDPDYYAVYTASTLASRVGDNESVSCYGYDVTKDGAGFVLWPLDEAVSATVGDTTPTGVVESITTGVNEDGGVVKVMNVFINGQWKKVYSPAEYSTAEADFKAEIEKVKPGDIIRMSTDNKNTITALHIDFSYVNDKTFYTGYRHTGPAKYGGNYVAYASGYAYAMGGGKATVIQNKTIEEINNETLAGTLSLSNIYPVNLSSGTTVYVELKRDRSNPDLIISADVYKEPNNDSVETYFSAGIDADYIVSRARFHAIAINVVYVN